MFEFSEKASHIVITKAIRQRTPQTVMGCLKTDLNKSVEEYLADLRGEVELPAKA